MDKKMIDNLMKNNRCWYLFNIQRDHVLESVNMIHEVLDSIHVKGYSELSDITRISNELDVIKNQMPKKEN